MRPISEKNAPKRPIEISCEKDFENAPNFRNCAQSGNTDNSLFNAGFLNLMTTDLPTFKSNFAVK